MENETKQLFSVSTFGCKVNQYESEVIIWELKKRGWIHTASKNNPHLYIINTCAVTGKSAMQARQLIRKIIRQHPRACIVVTGCYAQTGSEEIEKIKGVHYIIGQSDKHMLPEKIDLAFKDHFQSHSQRPVTLIENIQHIQDISASDAPVSRNRTRPVVKIQDGCNSFCTYCIVPYARGRSRSLPRAQVIDQINRLWESGYSEIVLTGIHLGNFGKDLVPETNLSDLLKQILASTSIPRIRLSSIESNEVSEDMVLLMRDSKRICNHFHLPLQSGDNDILSKMNRPYNRNDYKDKVFLIHRNITDCGLGADVLVGFPGEDEAAFKNTMELIHDLPLTYLHVFPFSPRKGTPAATFADQISPSLIKERCHALREIGDQKKLKFYQSLMGSRTTVLLEEKSNIGKGLLKGLSSHYVPVHVAGEDTLKNTIVEVTIKKIVVHPTPKIQTACIGEVN